MPNWIYFILATLSLVLGYIVYGAFVEKVFGADMKRPVPAQTKADGIDYMEMPAWKVWLIQLLNIAGVGPVFGPILGALYGPAALLWIVIGSIFAGAVHDYMAGMMSVRYGGANVPAIVGYNLGNAARQVMRVFSVVLLVLVGVAFVSATADLLSMLSGGAFSFMACAAIIFAYYFVATVLPIEAIIGRLYPIFGAVLLFMAIGITLTMFVSSAEFYNSAEWTNQHPLQLPLFPLVFITIACGAISGFHSTQSPLMARCLANERLGRPVFYGGMIVEGFIGLVWATVGMSFYHGSPALAAALNAGPGAVVLDSCKELLGSLGGPLAILGVVALPITSGDTAFRAARVTIADALKLDQKGIAPRLLLAVPLFIVGIALSQINFNIIWRYFGFANQALAAIVLWAGAAYLAHRERLHWICTIPAAFMTAVCVTYICYEPKMGFGVEINTAMIIGFVFAMIGIAFSLLTRNHLVTGEPEGA